MLLVRHAVRTVLVLVSLVVLSVGAPAQQPRNEPGKFDFYVLALSWSPSYCASLQERATERPTDPQCAGRPFGFVVHGLWPQYERGFPSFCQKPAPRIGRSIADNMLDLMPSPRLVYYEWNRHGTCSGLTAQDYFDAVRKARAAVKLPAEFAGLAKPQMVTPAEVSAAFRKANPALPAGALAVACDTTRLTEVRVCLGKDFSFRDCPDVVSHACSRDKIAMPAVSGG